MKGAPKRVTSIGVRRAIEGVNGFLIQDFHKEDPVPKPKKVVVKAPPQAPVEEPEGETDSEEDLEPAPAPKRKTTKRKKVKKVKGGKNA